MSYKGKFKPNNYQKYKGDSTNIIYRSLLERKFMVYCDTNPWVLQWSSEEIIVPYISPKDNRWHRYFPDFYMKYRDNKNNIRECLVEVKPHSQTMEPKRNLTSGGKPTRRFLTEAITWSVNQAKWKAAIDYCLDRKWEFKILTEKELR
ncbi:head completion protein [bacterium]|nr:head completion protein [bacterium]